MKLYLLVLLILLAYRPADAQNTPAILRWVTSEGLVGTYIPATQTLSEYQIDSAITTHNVYWLPDQEHFVYLSDNIGLQVVDTQSGSVTCSLELQSSDRWEVSPHQVETLLLYETVDSDQTAISQWNWRTCVRETLMTLDGVLYLTALSPDVPLVAISVNAQDEAVIYILDLMTGVTHLVDRLAANSAVYWTQDSAYLLIENEQEKVLFERTTDTTRPLSEIMGSVWPVPGTSLLLRSGVHDDRPTQFWDFVDGQVGDLVLEIAHEVYDHSPGFSPDNRYYAYSQTNAPGEMLVFDRQTATTINVDQQAGLKRWSPDSRWLALIDFDADQLRFYNMQTDERQVFTGHLDWYGDDLWSHDGRFITFWQRDADEEHLLIADIATGSITPVFTRQALGLLGSVRWSPDDAYLYVNALSVQTDKSFTSCHVVIEVATGATYELGCGVWNVHWGT